MKSSGHALAIPPAWKKVWICPWAAGHLQAVGYDARGRRGELRIEFFGTEDLLRHLFDLSQAIVHDYRRFEALTEGTGSSR